MRFEEPVINLVARFPELRAHRSRQTVPSVTQKELVERVARGDILHVARTVVYSEHREACGRVMPVERTTTEDGFERARAA